VERSSKCGRTPALRALGVLKLTLHAGSYNWQFVPVRARASQTPGVAPVTKAVANTLLLN
jgi:hypothetical protein